MSNNSSYSFAAKRWSFVIIMFSFFVGPAIGCTVFASSHPIVRAIIIASIVTASIVISQIILKIFDKNHDNETK